MILNSVPFPYHVVYVLRTLADVKFGWPSRGNPGVLAPLSQLLDRALGHTSSPSPPAGYCQPGLAAPGLGCVQGGFTAQPIPILEKQLRPASPPPAPQSQGLLSLPSLTSVPSACPHDTRTCRRPRTDPWDCFLTIQAFPLLQTPGFPAVSRPVMPALFSTPALAHLAHT